MAGVMWLKFQQVFTPTVSEVFLTTLLLSAAAFKISNVKIASWITFQIR